MNINELQETVYKIAVSFGYKTDKKSTIKKIKEELKEFARAEKCVSNCIHRVLSDTENEESFNEGYSLHVKDKEECEIADIIFVCLTYAFSLDIDIEDVLLNKKRHNLNRLKKMFDKA